MDPQLTVGLEIHAELKTRTKMFCDSLNDPDEHHPNLNVCPVCLGHPGTLPVVNRDAVAAVIRIGLALGGKISPRTKFDRKNYFYPDLPKGYQISQFDEPIVSDAKLEIEAGGERKTIRIRRVHLEEDAASSTHDASGATLVDYNRAGVPLMELVTEPDVRSAEEALAFAKELQLILRSLGISDANMEKGQMRVEANTSVDMGTRTEVKNLNSFRSVGDAIRYEFERQKKLLARGEKVKQETRGWDEAAKKTVSQRSKEEAHDYRYFPEPDLPPFETASFDLEALKASLPELPREKRARFKEQFQVTQHTDKPFTLSESQTELLIAEPKMADYFEDLWSEILDLCNTPTPNPVYPTINDYPNFTRNVIGRGFSYLTNNLESLINSGELERKDAYDRVSPEHLAHFAFLVEFGLPELNEGDKKGIIKTEKFLEKMSKTGLDPEELLVGLTSQQSKDILAKIYSAGSFNIKSAKRDLGFTEKIAGGDLEAAVARVLEENPAAVADYKKGKQASLQFLVGKTMAATKGKARPEEIQELLVGRLS